ncbi:helix-turn-helix transcriptional regulator [Bacillaceae bacterium Marseille-Q3522]|nr:helix-turn-helix transcriptional regulator [Bacillaceae bacterium Marseille-Q3522]
MKISGGLIKFYRVKSGIKQENLATGICSVSYLSKIENEKINPNSEVLTLLMKRLNITQIKNTEVETTELINKLYKKLTAYRDLPGSNKLISSLESSLDQSSDYKMIRKFELLKAFYFLLKGQLDAAHNCIERVSLAGISDSEQFYLLKYKGLYFFLKQEYVKSQTYYQKSKEVSEVLVLEDWEEADLSYLLAMVSIKNKKIFLGINEINSALTIYQHLFITKRIIDCYILLALFYKYIPDYSKAIRYLQYAKNISTQTKSDVSLSIIYQNMGEIYSSQHSRDEAIKSFKLSLDKKNENKNLQGQCNSIFSLIKEYQKLNDYKNMGKYIDIGLSLINNKESKNLQDFLYHFSVCSYERSDELMENIPFIEEAIEYFSKKNVNYAVKYSLLLADCCYENRSYKYANNYNVIARDLLLADKNIADWRDI